MATTKRITVITKRTTPTTKRITEITKRIMPTTKRITVITNITTPTTNIITATTNITTATTNIITATITRIIIPEKIIISCLLNAKKFSTVVVMVSLKLMPHAQHQMVWVTVLCRSPHTVTVEQRANLV